VFVCVCGWVCMRMERKYMPVCLHTHVFTRHLFVHPMTKA